MKQYFNVTFDSVKRRAFNSLIPFNPTFHNISKERPDLYGPFWIYTTLIFLIAATGEITSYLNGDTNSYFEEFVPKSAILVRYFIKKIIFNSSTNRFMALALDFLLFCGF